MFISALPSSPQGFYDASLVLVQKSRGEVEPTFAEKLMTWYIY
jgi:hypothetical protein